MNKFFIFFLFFSTIVLSQFSSYQDLKSSKLPLTYYSNDTILGLPIFSNNFHFFTKTPITDWYDFGNHTIDFENYIIENKDINMTFFLDNNIINYSFPFRDSYLSFGINHHAYGKINFSNDLLNLFWNGNLQYLDETISFSDNTLNYIQFSSIYLQYYFELNSFKMGTRLNFLHGINYFDLDKGNFVLNPMSNLITPFSTSISTNIYAQKSNAGLIGFSNPGFSIDYKVKFNVSNFNFLFELENLGFIYWNKDPSTYQSNSNYLFNGFNYTMDQVISEEFQNTLDTLSDVFAINSEKKNPFLKRTPINISFETNLELNTHTTLFINLQSMEEFGGNDNLSFLNLYFIGLSKNISDNIMFYTSYNYNKLSPINLSLGISARFDNFLLKLNTNNFFALISEKYFHFNTALYYLF